jgi:hypothetical protein
VLKAVLMALAIVGWLLLIARSLEASQIPVLDPCDFLENEFLRWLAGCPPLDSGAS